MLIQSETVQTATQAISSPPPTVPNHHPTRLITSSIKKHHSAAGAGGKLLLGCVPAPHGRVTHHRAEPRTAQAEPLRRCRADKSIPRGGRRLVRNASIRITGMAESGFREKGRAGAAGVVYIVPGRRGTNQPTKHAGVPGWLMTPEVDMDLQFFLRTSEYIRVYRTFSPRPVLPIQNIAPRRMIAQQKCSLS